MKREWKPGDVAMLRCRDGVERIAILTDRADLSALWIASGPDWGRLSDDVPVRPLVVIDPEDREQVERLADLIEPCGNLTHCEPNQCGSMECWAGRMQAALRSLVTPPKPDEPQGLGAVVEDGQGNRWSRNGFGTWCAKAVHDANYSSIDVVRILSEGVQP